MNTNLYLQKSFYRIDSRVSIDVTLLPRMTCNDLVKNATMRYEHRDAYNCANRMFLSWCCLFDGIIDNQVQEKVISPQDTADLAATLQVNEQFFVHELQIISF